MLEYVALVMLLLSITAVFYIFIFIHDLPHHVAKKRNHPQVEAIHYACWLSLFTLHALWPIVFLWAVSGGKPIGVAVTKESTDDSDQLKDQVAKLSARLAALESKAGSEGKGA